MELRLYEVAQVAKMLNSSTRYVYQIIKSGELEAYKVRSRYVVSGYSIFSFLNNKKVTNE